MSTTMQTPAILSERGTTASAGSRETLIWDVLNYLWHPKDNPSGFVSLGVAENALMHDELQEFIKQSFDISQHGLTYGDGPLGSKRLRNVVCRFLNRRLQPVIPIKLEQVIMTNGVTTAIEHCAWALANKGDGVLLGQPHYGAFVSDMETRPGVKTVKVSFGKIDPCSVEAVGCYESALLASHKSGVRVKALMLCSPHNPLGRCYSRAAIIGLMKLCQKHQIHLISDEIYAFSVWENTVDTHPAPEEFISVLSIATEGIVDPSLVHVLWGMSKDFGANGLRVGCIISQANPKLLSAIRSVSLPSVPSSVADHITANILEDDEFTDQYIGTNRRRLAESYAFAVRFLRRYKIPYAPGVNAGFFLWIDLGKVHKLKLGGDDGILKADGEDHDITRKIMDILLENKIFIASGDSFGSEEPGRFRIVFSQPRMYLEEGLRRIVEALGLEEDKETGKEETLNLPLR